MRRAVPSVLCFLAAAFLAAGAPARPERIVSLNLCSDQYLLALADEDQIAGLSRNAANPALSALAGKARGLPILDRSAERLLVARPDLVLGLAGEGALPAPLQGRGIAVLPFAIQNNFAEITDATRRIATAIGQQPRGEALIRTMERQLAALPPAPARRALHGPGARRPLVAAYYQRRGFLTGGGTLIDDLMHRVGLLNLATILGKPPLSRLSLEELVAARPDLLILDDAPEEDEGAMLLHHPALRTIPRIHLGQQLTVCGGPSYPQAAAILAQGVARLFPQGSATSHQKPARSPR